MRGRHPSVTVEADQVRLELRLAARRTDCPECPGVLRAVGTRPAA